MLQKIDNTHKSGNAHISILYPGSVLTDNDTGYYSIGRIDQAHIQPGTVIRMHPHINDDILSYFRSGKAKHTDSEGFIEYISADKLMLMKAGKIFYHEEAIEEELEGLQIFIRPREKDAAPEVIFQDLNSVFSDDEWRLIASPDKSTTPLQLSSDTWIYDILITKGNNYTLPHEPQQHHAYLLYLFQGEVLVNETITLQKGESLFIRDENIQFSTHTQAEIVLFQTNTESPYYDGGMYSGNRNAKK